MPRGFLLDVDHHGRETVDPRRCEHCGCKLKPTTPPGYCGDCREDFAERAAVTPERCTYKPGSGRPCGCSLCRDIARSRAGMQ